jgi:hypothetical protein
LNKQQHSTPREVEAQGGFREKDILFVHFEWAWRKQQPPTQQEQQGKQLSFYASINSNAENETRENANKPQLDFQQQQQQQRLSPNKQNVGQSDIQTLCSTRHTPLWFILEPITHRCTTFEFPSTTAEVLVLHSKVLCKEPFKHCQHKQNGDCSSGRSVHRCVQKTCS